MYKVNGEQCKKCGKLFHPDNKVLKMVDADGNELHIDLCNSCELDTMVEEVMALKHISREEADKYIYNQINDLIDNAINRVKPYNGSDLIKYDNEWNEYSNIWYHPFTTERFDKLVRMVKE